MTPEETVQFNHACRLLANWCENMAASLPGDEMSLAFADALNDCAARIRLAEDDAMESIARLVDFPVSVVPQRIKDAACQMVCIAEGDTDGDPAIDWIGSSIRLMEGA